MGRPTPSAARSPTRSPTLYKNVLASLPPNYQLQPGDSLTVRYSALTLAPRELNVIVDAQGGVSVEGVGRIAVAGRTAAQAETTLTQRLSRLYRSVDVSISLRQLRTIQVTVSGSAFAPGTYTVPASATAFNVLNAAGGPTANGSLRDIRVLRGGRLGRDSGHLPADRRDHKRSEREARRCEFTIRLIISMFPPGFLESRCAARCDSRRSMS